MPDRSYFDLFARADQDAVSYVKGTTVFDAGAAGDCFFVVRSGEVRLHAGDQDVETVTRGGIFGEMALVDGSTRSLSATAASDCDLIRIDEPRFHYLLHEAPYFAQEVMRVMANRLRANTQHLG